MIYQDFSLDEIADAIRKNGWKKAIGSYYRTRQDGTIIAACALGQGALNLDVTPRSLQSYLDSGFNNQPCPSKSHKKRERPRLSIGVMVVHLNDDHRWSLNRIADWVDTIGDSNDS